MYILNFVFFYNRLFGRIPHLNVYLLPAYVYASWSILTRLAKTISSPLWTFIYMIALCLVLVPSPLMEPRYFTVPLIMLHLNLPKKTNLNVCISIMVSMAVNLITIYIFLAKGFERNGVIERFMW